MTLTVKRPVQYKGHIYRRGDMITLADGVEAPANLAANCEAERGIEPPRPADSPAPAASAAETPAETPADALTDAEKIERTVEVLKLKGIRQQLDQMNITYSPSSNAKYLAKLLLISKGEIKEA